MSVLARQSRHRRDKSRRPLPPLRTILLFAGAVLLLVSVVYGVGSLGRALLGTQESRTQTGRIVVARPDGWSFAAEAGAESFAIRALDSSKIAPEFGPVALSNEDLHRLIDALGGISVTVPEQIEYRRSDGTPVTIEPGVRRLDGERIGIYLEAPGVSRAGQVRAVVLGVLARTEELIKEGYDIVEILEAALPEREKDAASRIASLLVGASTIGAADVAVEWPSDTRAYARPKAESSSPFSAPTTPLPARKLRIRVLNATGTSGLAARAAARLSGGHFTVVETGNTESSGLERTAIRSAHLDWAREVAQNLGMGDPVLSADVRDVDVIVILGSDARRRL